MVGNPYLTRTIALYGKLEYTYPVTLDDVCLVTLKAGPIPNWKLITMAFTGKTWIGCFILFWIIFLSWYLLRKLNQHITKLNVEFLEVLFDSFQMFIIVQVNRRIEQLYERIYIVAILWVLLVISVAGFQGSLSSIFTTVFNYPEINTLKSVLDHNLRIYVGNLTTAHLFFSPESPIYEVSEMGKRATLYKDGLVPLWLPKVIKDSVVIVRKSFPETGPWAKYFLDFGGEYHLIKECTGPSYNGYIVKKHGMINNEIQKVNLRLFEGGFFKYWYGAMAHSRKVEFRAQYVANKTNFHEVDNMHTLQVDDLVIAFGILAFGFFISFISLGVERFFGNVEIKENRLVEIQFEHAE